jgi:hypothetical protein
MKRYRIALSPHEPGRWILYDGDAIYGGTWRECVQKLNELLESR